MARLRCAAGTYDYEVAGDGPLVVFGHGLSCDRHQFDLQIASLKSRYCCVSLDWPGHGSLTTFEPTGWTLDTLAADTISLIEHLDRGPAALVGLSQGAMVFIRVALVRPTLVAALVLLDTSARAEPPQRAAAIKANLVSLREATDADRERFIRDSALPAFFGAPWRLANPELVESEVERRLAHDPLGYELAVSAVIDRSPIELGNLAALDVSTLVVVGELDVLTPPEHAEELAAAIPGAELAIVPSAGHHTPVEQPDLVTSLIEGRLASLQR